MSRVAHPAGPRSAPVLPADHHPAARRPGRAVGRDRPGSARRSGGVLHVGGVDVRELARPTACRCSCATRPTSSRCTDYRDAFGPDAGVFYAAKAFCSKAVLRWVSEEGLGVDVCTGGSWRWTWPPGCPANDHAAGNNKTVAELTRAVQAGVGHIVLDSFEEIARLALVVNPDGMTPPVRRPGSWSG